MYRIPTYEEITRMEESFPMIIREANPPKLQYQPFSIVRKALCEAKDDFFNFEGRQDSYVISIFQLGYGKDGLTGSETWDELNRIIAVKALLAWAKNHKARLIIAHTNEKHIFEVLWDLGFGNFSLEGKRTGMFSACGTMKI